MKLFKTIEEKIEDLGYKKTYESDLVVDYEKKEKISDTNEYIHKVELIHKKSGRHLLLSYDPNLEDNKGIGNTCVGLTAEEIKIFAKKMKQMWK